MLINPTHWAFSLLWPVKLLTAEGILSYITQNTELFLKVKSMSTPSYSPKPPPPPIPIPPSPALSPHFHLYLFLLLWEKALTGNSSHLVIISWPWHERTLRNIFATDLMLRCKESAKCWKPYGKRKQRVRSENVWTPRWMRTCLSFSFFSRSIFHRLQIDRWKTRECWH